MRSSRNHLLLTLLAIIGLLVAGLVTAQASPQKTSLVYSSSRPLKSGDVSCAVVEWNVGSPKPALTLVCPPEEVFAPLRVYLKLTWRQQEEVPKDCLSIVGERGAATKLRAETNQQVFVRLNVYEKGQSRVRQKWVGFSKLETIALLNER